jgi:hypothetical protein
MEVSAMERLERAELEAVLASGIFAKSPNLAKLLSYICEKYWEGKADQLKEYSMGVEVLGRPPDFDPSSSAAVRVEVHRLREKLRKYYESEGADHQITIALQPGRYAPHFLGASDRLSASNLSPSTAVDSEVVKVLRLEALEPAQRAGQAALALSNAPAPPQAAPGLLGVVETRRRHKITLAWLILLTVAGVGALLIGVLAVRHLERQAGNSAEFANKSAQPASKIAELRNNSTLTARNAARLENNSALPAVLTAPGVRVIAGYFRKSYIDRSGNVWQGDAYFDGGGVDQNSNQFIFRSSDPTLFQTDRHGEFSYNVPLKPGDYELWLYFAETVYGPGTLLGGGETSRLFDVELNGHTTLLDAFDVFSDAGGNFIADVRVFKDIHPETDGYLRISFLRRTADPFVNAIRIVPGLPGKLRPIRIVAQDDSYTDRSGEVWSPDNYFRNGRTALRRSPVSGTDDPGLFDGERYGNFDYAIPVAQGKYTITLYFSERYFGPGMPGGGGPGSRVFDVTCNGNTLLKNFDIFKTAGGADRALTERFRGIEGNAQGKLFLRFVPVVNYALVDAIEVTDEGK